MTGTTVLIVEDEQGLADLYTTWLEDEYVVRTAYGGESALSQLDDTVDVVLLDRRMPDLTGDEVLDELRSRGTDCRVAMVTAVEPDFDVIEMGFDDYIVKPVTADDLVELIDRLLDLESYDDSIQQYYQLASKKAALEGTKSEEELADSEEYAALVDEFERVRARTDAMIEDMSADELFDLL